MGIKVIGEDEDVLLTREELERFQHDYQKDFAFFSGPVPSFESYCRRRLARAGRDS